MAGAAVDEVLPAWFILACLVGLGRWMRHRHRETEQLQARAVRTEQEIAEEAARAVADDGVRDRVQAVIVAFRAGIVPVDPGRTAQRLGCYRRPAFGSRWRSSVSPRSRMAATCSGESWSNRCVRTLSTWTGAADSRAAKPSSVSTAS